jgi:hypothetical protein
MRRRPWKMVRLVNGPLDGQKVREITYQTLTMTFRSNDGSNIQGYYDRLGNWVKC